MPRPSFWPSPCPCCDADGLIQPRHRVPTRRNLSKYGLETRVCETCARSLIAAIKTGRDPLVAFKRRKRRIEIYTAGVRALAGSVMT
jgi:hypothetical protein